VDAWDSYLAELETYGEGGVPEPASGLPEARTWAGAGLTAIQGAGASHGGLVSTLLGFVGAGFAVARLARRASLPVTVRAVVESVTANATAWADLVEQEATLRAAADHASVSFRMLTLCECALRDLIFARELAVSARVIAGAGSQGAFLDKVLSSGHGMTWSALAAWLRGMEGAIAAQDATVHAWLSARLAHPETIGRTAASRVMNELAPYRNGLAHADGSSVPRAQHEDAATRLLGAPCRTWWKSHATAHDARPVTAIMVARAQWQRERGPSSR
jgi:hypothetical protein